MTDLRDLYQELILEHARSPRNFRAIDGGRHADGLNPLCGDRFTVYLSTRDGIVTDAAFTGQGCAISTASASVMTETIKGRSETEVEQLFSEFHGLVTRGGKPPDGLPPKLAVFGGVSDYPARVKCASLAWHALHAALSGQQEAVSTE